MSDLININTADLETLSQLNGIAEALAARIIEYRETVHPFEEVIELAAVPGISERMVRKFEAQVTVSDEVSTDEAEDDESADEALTDTESPVEETVATALPMTLNAIETEDIVEAEPDEPDIAPAPLDDIETEDIVETEPEPDIVPALSFAAEPAAQREEPIQTMTNEMHDTTTSPQAAPPMAAANDAIPRRRGCLFAILSAILGAALGVAATLGILSAINGGSLQYARSNSQLRLQLETVTQSLDDLTQELETTTQQLESMATRTGELADGQTEMGTSLQDMTTALDETQTGLRTAQTEIDDLAETAVALDERIDTVSAAAETFDAFLTGMRDLLVDLQGIPVPTRTPVGTETPVGTAVPGLPTAGGTETAVTATPRATRVPTRTPRPTSTPITLPTPTPVQQP
ncbi:MAG: helix-hairpin-helix domain-containing protein [Anaerolineales bacterium]|nr:helix-hairpin-helix domain-containing protein [Anaerolineales bacterium]